jgi:hypothetical protein
MKFIATQVEYRDSCGEGLRPVRTEQKLGKLYQPPFVMALEFWLGAKLKVQCKRRLAGTFHVEHCESAKAALLVKRNFPQAGSNELSAMKLSA